MPSSRCAVVDEVAVALRRNSCRARTRRASAPSRPDSAQGRASSRRRRSSATADRAGRVRGNPPGARRPRLKMRRSTDGIVTMVGPMSKRKPSPRSSAALPPSQSLRSKSDDLVPARGEHAGRGEPAESAADDADGFHSFLRLDFSMSAATNSRIAAKRCRPCAARM